MKLSILKIIFFFLISNLLFAFEPNHVVFITATALPETTRKITVDLASGIIKEENWSKEIGGNEPKILGRLTDLKKIRKILEEVWRDSSLLKKGVIKKYSQYSDTPMKGFLISDGSLELSYSTYYELIDEIRLTDEILKSFAKIQGLKINRQSFFPSFAKKPSEKSLKP